MKLKVYIVSGFIAFFCLACKKDKGEVPTPEKVVNYRKSFIGSYVGSVYTTTQSCVVGNPNIYGLIDTTSFYSGSKVNVTLYSSNDSAVVIDYGDYSVYEVKKSGWAWPLSKAGHDSRDFHAVFRNDSMYLYIGGLPDNINNTIILKYTNFVGVKK